MSIPTSLYEDLKPHLEKIEQVRRPYLWFRQIGVAIMAIILGVILIYVIGIQFQDLQYLFSPHSEKDLVKNLNDGVHYAQFFNPFLGYVIMSAYPAMFLMGINQWLNSKMSSAQEEIFIKILHQVHPGLIFSKKNVTKEKIMPSGFFPHKENTLFSLPLSNFYAISKSVIEGEIKQIKVEFADINVVSTKIPSLLFIPVMLFVPVLGIIVTYGIFFGIYLKNLFGKRRDLYMDGFKGLFFEANSSSNFKGLTVILPDNFEKKIGFLAKTVQELKKNQGKLIYLEDPRFEKEFVVYSNDEIETRTILSFRFMEKIVELKKKFDRPLFISFSGTKVYVAVLDVEGFFEVSLKKNVLNSGAIERIYNNLKICTEIIEDLKLNILKKDSTDKTKNNQISSLNIPDKTIVTGNL